MKNFMESSRTQKWICFLAISQAILIGWALIVTVASATGDGMFYSIKRPVHIVDIRPDRAILELTRSAAWPMGGVCSYEIECSNLVTQLGQEACPIEAGDKTFKFSLIIPEGSTSPCQFRGTITYTPFGPFGPHFTEEWSSDIFELVYE